MSKNKRIGRYQIIKKLGRGGMGIVFKAYDPAFERDVAVKVLFNHLTNDPSFRARFEEEARMVARLEHPAIVAVYDLGEEWKKPYLVMRYMTGGTLKDRLEEKVLSLDEISEILSRLATGLDEVHEKGIIHRDIKPANVFFDEDDQAYLADFCIARLIVPNGMTIAGKSRYMAPEQRAGQNVDHRADIYSLGMVLLEMLTGSLPSTWRSHSPLPNEILSLLHSNPDLPPGCDRVMTRALARKKKDRFASAGDLAHAFKLAIAPSLAPISVTDSALIPISITFPHIIPIPRPDTTTAPTPTIGLDPGPGPTLPIILAVLTSVASVLLLGLILLYRLYPPAI